MKGKFGLEIRSELVVKLVLFYFNVSIDSCSSKFTFKINVGNIWFLKVKN